MKNLADYFFIITLLLLSYLMLSWGLSEFKAVNTEEYYGFPDLLFGFTTLGLAILYYRKKLHEKA